MAYYNWVHGLGLHSWDLPTIVVAVILVVIAAVQWHKQKKRNEEARDAAEEAVPAPAQADNARGGAV